MATFDTYTAVGNREDLSDLIYNIAPTETPGLSAIGVGKATATLHEWQRDDLDAPADNVTDEGDDPSAWDGSPPTRLNNNCQISRKTVRITGSQEAVSKAGRDSELGYQSAKRARELKTDVDLSIFGTNKAKVATDPRESASLESWLTNSNRNGAGTPGADPTGDGSDAATDCSLVRSFAQSQLDDVIQQCWALGGKPSLILAGPVQKTAMSGFDGVGNGGTNPGNASATQIGRLDRSQGTIWASMDVYASNFGTLMVTPSRHIRKTSTVDRNVFVIDPEYLKVAYLRPWQQFDLAKTGDNIKREMLVEWSLEVCNQDAHGIVADLGVQT